MPRNGNVPFFVLHTDVRSIREKTGLNQREFSRKYGIPKSTLQNWEQGIRKPDTATCVLLHLIGNDPEGIAERMKYVTRRKK